MINGISRYTDYQSTINATAKKDREEDMFTNIDTNGDGSVDKAEFTAFGRQMAAKIGKADKSEEIFSAMDTDGDGQISMAELTAFDEKMKSRMKEETPVAANTAIDAKNDSISTLLDALNQDSNNDNTLYQNTIQQYAANIDAFTPSSNLDILG